MPRRTAVCGHPSHSPILSGDAASVVASSCCKQLASPQDVQDAGRPRLAPGPMSLPTIVIVIPSPALGGEPVVHVLAGLVLGQTIALLKLALELIAAAVDDVEVIVGELAPLLLDPAFDLLPVSFHAIPVHYLFSSICCEGNAGCSEWFLISEPSLILGVCCPKFPSSESPSGRSRGHQRRRCEN